MAMSAQDALSQLATVNDDTLVWVKFGGLEGFETRYVVLVPRVRELLQATPAHVQVEVRLITSSPLEPPA